MAYTAVVLDKRSHEKLVGWLMFQYGLTEGWLVKCHHMTVDMRPIESSMAQEWKDRTVYMHVVRVGIGDRILAVEVRTDCPSVNEIPHITLTHSPDVKPRSSNDIEDWEEVDFEFLLAGVCQQVG